MFKWSLPQKIELFILTYGLDCVIELRVCTLYTRCQHFVHIAVHIFRGTCLPINRIQHCEAWHLVQLPNVHSSKAQTNSDIVQNTKYLVYNHCQCAEGIEEMKTLTKARVEYTRQQSMLPLHWLNPKRQLWCRPI